MPRSVSYGGARARGLHGSHSVLFVRHQTSPSMPSPRAADVVLFGLVSTEQLTFNPTDWATWLRLDAITTDSRASDDALVAELRNVKRTLREGQPLEPAAIPGPGRRQEIGCILQVRPIR